MLATIHFDHPDLLWLLLIVPFLVVVWWRSLADLPGWQLAVSLLVRTVIIAALVIGLVRPHRFETTHKIAVAIVADVSDSIPDEALKESQAFIDAAWVTRGDTEIQVVTFAARPHLVRNTPAPASAPAPAPARAPASAPAPATASAPASTTTPAPRLARHTVDQGGGRESDVAAALRMTVGLFPTGTIRRVVLLSDGRETRGSALAAASELAALGVRLHVVPLTIKERPESLVRSLQAPDKVALGKPFDIRAEVWSNIETDATLAIEREGYRESERRAVKLKPGTQEVSFRVKVSDPGLATFRVQLTAVKDTVRENNTVSEAVFVEERPRVLYVEGEDRFAHYLANALRRQELDVQVRGASGFPMTVAELLRFDLVVLSDVAALYVSPGQMRALESYVSTHGGGFIMAGGVNSFGPGGYHRTRVEALLPVRLDIERRREAPTIAIALLIDKSGSMQGPKIEMAKDAAKAVVELLGNEDQLAVIAFDSAAHALVALQPASNRSRILSDISRLYASGGTNFYPPLELAYQDLAATRARHKHVILLSDGQAPQQGIAELVDNMQAEQITVSTVGVGGDTDMRMLRMIAERGGGRWYFTEDAHNVPKIFAKETTTLTRTAVVDLATNARVAVRAQFLKGIDMASAPVLTGYISTKPRPQAEVVLVSDFREPILARWRYGLGKVAAFTSDVKNRWGAEWLGWGGYAKFWAQLARDTMRQRFYRRFDMRAVADEEHARVVAIAVDDNERTVNGLTSTLEVTDPKGKRAKVALNQSAPGQYEAKIPLASFGSYALHAEHRGATGALVGVSDTGVIKPYPREFAETGTDVTLLESLASTAQGAVHPSHATLMAWHGEPGERHREDLWPFVVAAALALFLIDVFLRRVRLGRAREVRL